MTQMNILHVTPTYNDCSITRIILNILERLGSSDYNWFIAGPDHGEMIQKFTAAGADTLIFSEDKWEAMRQINDYTSSNNIHLVHTHTPRTMILAWPTLLRKRGMPSLYTKHLLTNPQDRDNGWMYALVDRLSLYLADHLAPVSKTMGQQIVRYPGLRESRVTPVQNAIDHNYFYAPEARDEVRAEFGFNAEDVVIGFTGRIEPMKRLDMLIDSFATVKGKHPYAKLLIVGIGYLREALEAQIARLGLTDDVVWAGWRSDVPRILAAVDIYAQTSGNEGLSLSILEAMAARKAVVATEVGAIHEIMVHDKTGMIVPPEDTDGYILALDSLLSDADKRQTIADAARQFIEEQFTVEHMTSAYGRLYRQHAQPQAEQVYSHARAN